MKPQYSGPLHQAHVAIINLVIPTRGSVQLLLSPLLSSQQALYRVMIQLKVMPIWKKEISNTRKLRKSSDLRGQLLVRIKLATLQVLVRTL